MKTNLKLYLIVLVILFANGLPALAQDPVMHSPFTNLQGIITSTERPQLVFATNNKNYWPGSGITLAKSTIESLLKSNNNTETICYKNSSQSFLENDSFSLYVANAALTKDNNITVVGEIVPKESAYNAWPIVLKCDLNGNILWVKKYDPDITRYSYCRYYNFTELNDGSLVIAGYGTNAATLNHDIFLIRVDQSGNITWHQTYKSKYWMAGSSGGSGDYSYVRQVKQDPDSGDIFFTVDLWERGRVLTRVDLATGNIKWNRSYVTDGILFDRSYGIDIKNNQVTYFARRDGAISIYRVKTSNGDTITTRSFVPGINVIPDFYPSRNGALTKLNNGHYVVNGTTSWTGFPESIYTHGMTIEFDENLNLVQTFVFRNKYLNVSGDARIKVFPDGTGVFMNNDRISNYTRNLYYVQFLNGHILKQRKRLRTGWSSFSHTDAIRASDGSDIIISTLSDSASYRSRLEYFKMQSSDTASDCMGEDDRSTVIEPYSYIQNPSKVQRYDDNVFQALPASGLAIIDLTLIKTDGCVIQSHCDSVSIDVSDTTFCITDTLTIRTKKNIGCGANTPLMFEKPALASVVTLNDSTYQVKFNSPWTGDISTIVPGCSLLQARVQIRALASPGDVKLGPDSALCAGNTIQLSAGKGYANYAWQNGSTDSIFMVYTPGVYHVEAKDACGSISKDTIQVLTAPEVTVFAGVDRTKCNADTIHLEAPSGYLSYQWSPNYQSKDLTKRVAIVNPLVDTSYILRVEKSRGCFGFDTVNVRVNYSGILSLGADTSVCKNVPLPIAAPNGFISYLWNDGQQTQTIQPSQSGDYSITAISINGCISRDTIKVRFFELPKVTLDKRIDICSGENRLLTAGVYTSYLWQDGSLNATFLVRDTGRYYVRVTDVNNCQARDTVHILTILAVPSNFLPADTLLCSYGSVNLRSSRNFSAYKWNNGATSSNITVSKPGVYWLQSTDRNGCSGRDSIVITPIECLQGLFVPNVFSPNHDGKNDVFRALLFGDVSQFELTIYNRWGQQIFQSTDRFKGWDGMVGSKLADVGLYVWTCWYKLNAQSEKLEKGYLHLLR